WQIQAEHSGCLIRLQNLLQRASGFRLLILQQNRPSYRDGLITFLGQENSRVLDLHALGDFDAFEAELENQGQARILHLINLESLGKKEQQAFFKGLNYHREHIARTCPGILAFWLPEPLVREMALQAADFWAWREQVLDFTVPLEPVERVAFDWVKSVNMEAQGKQERIKEIKKFLARVAEQPSLSAADLKHELGNLYKSIGEYTKAEQVFTEAITDYRNLDEARACASVRHDLAELLARQGKSEQALKIFREQVLPVDERLGDVRSKAVTMGQIADIFQARGELDKALEIRQQEELPVYERLFDMRSKIITKRKIADILICRGQLDEALKILQEDCIPPMKEIGAVKDVAVFQSRLADIFHARGELDKALEIRQEEELPVYERLGDVYSLLIGRANLALLLHERDAEANKEKIEKLLRPALADAKRLKLPNETEGIKNIMKKFRIKAQ
ncbi:MAG: hypothetical protein D3905_16010, partial [Candidatus Electrothrix sp. AS4_5]|nr:hypothetical protein [Candidatus Electrothrix gigas]